MRALRGAPDRRAIGAHVGHPARRADGAMRLYRPLVRRRQRPDAGARIRERGEVTLLGHRLLAHDLGGAHVVVHRRVVGQWRAARTRHRSHDGLERRLRLERRPRVRVDHERRGIGPRRVFLILKNAFLSPQTPQSRLGEGSSVRAPVAMHPQKVTRVVRERARGKCAGTN